MVGQQGSHVGTNLQHGSSLPINGTAGLSFEQANQLLSNIFASIDQNQVAPSKNKLNAIVGSNKQKRIPGNSAESNTQTGLVAQGGAQAAANDMNGAESSTLQAQAAAPNSSQAVVDPQGISTIAVDAQGTNVAKRISRAANLNLEGAKAGRLAASRSDLRQNANAARQHVIYNTKLDVPSMDDSIGRSTDIIDSKETPRGLMQSNMKGMLKQAIMQNLQASSMLNYRPNAVLQESSGNNQSTEDASKLAAQPDDSAVKDLEVGSGAPSEQDIGDVGLFYGALDDDDVDYADTHNVAAQSGSVANVAPLQSAMLQHHQGALQPTELEADMQHPVTTNVPQNDLLHGNTQMLALEKDHLGQMPTSNNTHFDATHAGSKDFTINVNDILSNFKSGNFTSMAFIPADLPEDIVDNKNGKIMPIIVPRELYNVIFKPKGQ